MKNSITFYVNVGNKKYDCTLERLNKMETHVTCPAARIDQGFLHEDVPELIQYLPDYITEAKERKNHEEVIRFRITAEDKKKIEKKALKQGYTSISGYLRDLALKG